MTEPLLRELFESDAASLEPRRVAGRGERIVLYTSAECWRGASVSYVNIARGLANHGFRPHVLATRQALADEFAAAGIDAGVVGGVGTEAWRLRTALTALDARAVVVDRAHDLRVATLAKTGTHIPLINRYNDFRPVPPDDLIVRLAYRAALNEVVFLSMTARTRVLGVSPFMRRVRPATIHEGIDVDRFRPSRRDAVTFRRTHGLGAEPFLLAVGALSEEKRYTLLFDALHLLGRDAPLLVICGEGQDEWMLRVRAATLGIRVRFLGRLPQENLVGAYSASLGLVHAGGCETFGLAVLEAMACGRPVVASTGGALPEVLGSERPCGWLVNGDAPESFASALRTLVEDRDAATLAGNRGRERAAECFSLDLMESRYAELVSRNLPAVVH